MSLMPFHHPMTDVPPPSHPYYSFWVMASAGTGKTKLLIDRVLCLLLMGTHPKKIVCLTYTKAAAHEMMTRVLETVQTWEILSEEVLQNEIMSLSQGKGECLGQDVIETARSLFKTLRLNPLPIQTIHSFCQKILSEYPFESDLPLDFELMEEGDIQKIKTKTLYFILNDYSVANDLSVLSKSMSEAYVRDCLNYALDYRTKLRGPLEDFSKKRREFFKDAYVPSLSKEEIDVCFSLAQKIQDLGSKTLASVAENILKKERAAVHAEDFIPLFLTKEGMPRAKIATKALVSQDPFFLEQVERLSQRFASYVLYTQTEKMLHLNEAFDRVLQKALEVYKVFKKNKLDFDDLILKTHYLLENGPPWVHQAIDNEIDHLLLDEAQDTSPLQWDVLKRLIAHWNDRLSRTQTPRTLFMVGDLKQSIYRFQGADPHFYEGMADYFEAVFSYHGRPFFRVPLETCYRCAPEILEVVDRVCNHDHVRDSLLGDVDQVQHYPHKKNGGKVVAWPLVAVSVEGDSDLLPWTLLDFPIEKKDSKKELAHRITQKIITILASKEVLPSTGCSPKPSDILIIMKRRGSLMRSLQSSLIEKGIPVLSHDPSAFLDHLFIKDMLAFLLFLDCPFDDLNLCALLKSPMCGVSENDLMRLRTIEKNKERNHVWLALKDDAKLSGHYDYLNYFLKVSGHQPCYNLLYLFSKMAISRYVACEGEHSEYTPVFPLNEIESLHKRLLNLALEVSSVHGFSPYKMYEGIVEKALSSPTFTQASTSHEGHVTLMTIHGSKGLQSPIIILADSGDGGGVLHDPLIFVEDFYMLRQQGGGLHCLKNDAKKEDFEENHRLLYVGMTRAQDYLYITGIEEKRSDERTNNSMTWYDYIAPFSEKENWEDDCEAPSQNASVISMIPKNAAQEMTVSKVFLRGFFAKHASLFSTSSTAQTEHITYGIRVHKFFECVARYEERDDLVDLFPDLSKNVQNALLSLYQRHIEPLVKEGYGFQELSLYDADGVLHRMDHVIVTSTKVIIFDYKTGQSEQEHDEQLERYAHILSSLYPHHHYEKVIIHV